MHKGKILAEGVVRQRGPQQGRIDNFVCISSCRSGIEFATRRKSAGTDMAAYQ